MGGSPFASPARAPRGEGQAGQMRQGGGWGGGGTLQSPPLAMRWAGQAGMGAGQQQPYGGYGSDHSSEV